MRATRSRQQGRVGDGGPTRRRHRDSRCPTLRWSRGPGFSRIRNGTTRTALQRRAVDALAHQDDRLHGLPQPQRRDERSWLPPRAPTALRQPSGVVAHECWSFDRHPSSGRCCVAGKAWCCAVPQGTPAQQSACDTASLPDRSDRRGYPRRRSGRLGTRRRPRRAHAQAGGHCERVTHFSHREERRI